MAAFEWVRNVSTDIVYIHDPFFSVDILAHSAYMIR